MWRNYLIVGLRALAKSRTYAFITIFGLALGLAACLTILLFVRYELSYDRWIPGSDRAYQLQSFYHEMFTGDEDARNQVTSFVSRKALVKDFPQIENSVFLDDAGATIIQNGVPRAAEDFHFVDANLFDIIQMPFVKGDPRHALDKPGDMVLTETEASRYFPHQDPMGKTLTVGLGGRRFLEYRVTGVIRDPRKNTHMRLGIVARYDPQSFYAAYQPEILTEWDWQTGWVYLKLRPGADVKDIERQLPEWEKRNIPDRLVGGVMHNSGKVQDWRMVNIADVHLGEAQRATMTPGNDRATVLTFALIALLILGMAIVNFVNLATARGSQRAREVALRKVVGASRSQLVVQFVGESILITGLAMLFGLAITELLLPWFNAFLDADMEIRYFGSDGLLLPIVLLVLLVGTVGGLYPAFYLSRFQPASVLKANQSAAEAHGSGRLRNLLVIGQFAVSIGLIICTAVIYAQTIYARTADQGYKREGLIQIANLNGATMMMTSVQTDALRREFERVPGVERVSLAQIGVNPGGNSMTQIMLPGAKDPILIGSYSVDTQFFDTMGMKLLVGRGFDPNIARDDITLQFPPQPDQIRARVALGGNVVITELGARNLGFRTPQEALGKQASMPFGPENMKMPVTIVGVVRDARYRSVHLPLQAIVYTNVHNSFAYMMVRHNPGHPKEVMAGLEKTWRKMFPKVPFKADFADDRLREMYEGDEARGQMFGAFALLAVVIACLGLYGLAAFTAERRTKEIGIRKVLGARTIDIVRLLAWQFSRPVIIANLIAWPIAWWLMRDWLNGFDQRIALSPSYFIVAGLVALLIAIGTIAGHAMRVARANPIHALRYE